MHDGVMEQLLDALNTSMEARADPAEDTGVLTLVHVLRSERVDIHAHMVRMREELTARSRVLDHEVLLAREKLQDALAKRFVPG